VSPSRLAREYRPCRHCGRVRKGLVRRLCGRCHRDPAVRALYPLAGKEARFATKGPGGGNGGYRRADAPTDARPGTPEKVALLAGRVEAGVSLFRPDDARADLA
jgi:hypothetical protein